MLNSKKTIKQSIKIEIYFITKINNGWKYYESSQGISGYATLTSKYTGSQVPAKHRNQNPKKIEAQAKA